MIHEEWETYITTNRYSLRDDVKKWESMNGKCPFRPGTLINKPKWYYWSDKQ